MAKSTARAARTIFGVSRTRALGSVSLIALLASGIGGALAQDAEQTAQDPLIDQIWVTGTRIIRDGFEAPTPTSILTVEELQDAADYDLAETVNLMPAMSQSQTPTSNLGNVSAGLGGLNALNLRGLGLERTLVLLDGRRVVGANRMGIVDVSILPQQLISRVEVVTGGASAAYGSDAVGGVVNFVLDKEFEGIKGEASGGVTTYGDDRNWKVGLTGGLSFAGGRGHILLSGLAADKDGIMDGKAREWMSRGYMPIVNPDFTPTNGQPNYLFGEQTGFANAITGGLITTTALRGIAFGPGGATYPFTFGVVAGGNGRYMRGGDWKEQLREIKSGTIDPRASRENAFLHVSYDITENTEAFAQASWSSSSAAYDTTNFFFYGNITIQDDNPFIPDDLLAQMNALGITSFTMGLIPTDWIITGDDRVQIGATNGRITNRYVVGLDGTVDAFDTAWTWNAHVQKGITRGDENIHNVPIPGNYNLALDAVRDANGQIVCRSTLTDPGNGCVPYNPMGLGVNSLEAATYIVGISHRNERVTQDNFQINATGEPFDIWAGPVSVAFGIEWRKEKVTGAPPDPISAEFRFLTGNLQPSFGSYNVTEGFLETVVPLANDAEWARSLEVNAAVRATSYTTSGYVTTWKIGSTYQPIDEVLFRATYSHDIRAPNLHDLFFGGETSAGSGNLIDRFNNNVIAPALILSKGNPDLLAEKAYSLGVGVVVQPSFIPGFRFAADYWNTDLKDALDTIGPQNVVDICFDTGNPQMCNAITRHDDGRLEVLNAPFNIAKQVHRGIDFEANYTVPLEDLPASMSGDLNFRLLATHYMKISSDDTLSTPTDRAGGPTPSWQYNASLTYSNEPIRVTLSAHGFNSGKKNNQWVECATDCPAPTLDIETVNDNHRPGAMFLDLSGSYKFADGFDAFLSIQNLLDKDPAPLGSLGNPTPGVGVINGGLWESIGRQFRAGVRFTF